jgi:oligopeptide transport system permease protein
LSSQYATCCCTLTPGGPFDGERKVSAAVLANLQAKYHLDLPLWKQYLYYLDSLLHGDLGASFRYADWSVNDLVRARCRCRWRSAARRW